MFRRLLFCFLLVPALTASYCTFTSGGIVGPIGYPFTLTGTWQGDATSDFGSVRRITLDLRQVEFDVRGTATMLAPDGTVYFVGDVDGTRTDADVSLVLTAEKYDPITVRGRQTERGTMTVELTGSGWDGTEVTLKKK